MNDIGQSNISEERLSQLVERFYAKVRADEMIGSTFNTAVHDWPAHLEKLRAFWSSIMLTSGKYKGNPMAAHTKHADKITMPMFERWLDLWRETTEEVFDLAEAQELQAKARNIARSLKMALDYHATTRVPKKIAPLPKPYKTTPEFNQDTLPAALRKEHRTKDGVWGLIRVLSGQLRLHVEGSPEALVLTPEHPGVVLPTQTHWVEPLGDMKMHVEFYDAPPLT